MKYSITFFFFFLSQLTFSQHSYIPLVVEGAHWSYYKSYEGDYSGFGYVIRGDTVINETEYKKLYRRSFFRNVTHINEEYWSTYYQETFIGDIREDTTSQKVYLKLENYYVQECPMNEEALIYDFNLSQGEFISSCLNHEGEAFEIDNLTNEYLFGKERRVYFIGLNKIIEGIGFEIDLLETHNYSFTAAAGKNLHDYCIGTDEECDQVYDPTSSVNDISIDINIYPNPTKDILNMQIPNFREGQFSVFNKVGQIMLSGPLKSMIDVGSLADGIYFIKVNTEEGVGIKKFIKM